MIGVDPGVFWAKTEMLIEEEYDWEIAYLQALVSICRKEEIIDAQRSSR